MVRRGVLLIITTLALLAHAPQVYGAYGDPPLGSPSGAVYQLPLEQGRSDAAPKGGGTSAGSVAGQGSGTTSNGATSLYRSENNFGSSSQVPGLPPSGDGGGPGDGAGGIGSVAGGAATGAGAGGSAGAGAALGGATLAGAAELTDSGNASVPGSIALLLAIVLFATGIGVFSSRVLRRAN